MVAVDTGPQLVPGVPWYCNIQQRIHIIIKNLSTLLNTIPWYLPYGTGVPMVLEYVRVYHGNKVTMVRPYRWYGHTGFYVVHVQYIRTYTCTRVNVYHSWYSTYVRTYVHAVRTRVRIRVPWYESTNGMPYHVVRVLVPWY
jgi:hypothetical protein